MTQTDRKLIAKAMLYVLHRDAIRQCLSKFGKPSESNICEQRHKMTLRVNPKDRSNCSATAKARANTGLLRASVGKSKEIEETLSASGSFLSPCGGGRTHVESKKKCVEAENNRKRSAETNRKTNKRKKLNRRLTLAPRDPNDPMPPPEPGYLSCQDHPMMRKKHESLDLSTCSHQDSPSSSKAAKKSRH